MNRSEYLNIRNQLALQRNPSALLRHGLVDLLLVGAVGGLWRGFEDSWLRFAVVPLVFALIFRGFGIMHDAVHGAVSKNALVNTLVGIWGGSFCLLPYESWKRSHLKHHHWSGNVERDPVMALILTYPRLSKGMQKIISLGWQAWLPVLGFLQHVVFWNLSLKPLLKERFDWKVGVSLAAPGIFWAALIALTPADFVLGALVPSLFVYFVGIEVVNLPHHLGLPQHRGEIKFPVWEQYQTARSCVYPKWFAKWVILNFNYHTEHHMFPDAPWYCLDKIHEPVARALGESYNSDLYLGWILENKKKEMLEVLSSPPETNPAQKTAA